MKIDKTIDNHSSKFFTQYAADNVLKSFSCISRESLKMENTLVSYILDEVEMYQCYLIEEYKPDEQI